MIAILDYGLGNLRSVKNAFKFLGAQAKIITSPEEMDKVDALVVPGVGSFGDAIKGLKPFKSKILEVINSGKPLLGICLGLQVLFESSEENPEVEGFSYFQGNVKKLPNKVKLPQIGWNQISIKKNSKLFRSIPENSFVYFIHSYAVKPIDTDIVSATCNYGEEFVAAIETKNVFATQFHPEKSGATGLQIIKNFLEEALKYENNSNN